MKQNENKNGNQVESKSQVENEDEDEDEVEDECELKYGSISIKLLFGKIFNFNSTLFHRKMET